jgi:hypothetical protein
MDNTVRSLKLPSFNREHKTLQVWWTWFLAYTGMLGFTKAFCKGGESEMLATEEMPYDDVTTSQGQLYKAAKKQNVIAMADMVMAFTSKGTVALVYEAMDDDWPRGLVHKAQSNNDNSTYDTVYNWNEQDPENYN